MRLSKMLSATASSENLEVCAKGLLREVQRAIYAKEHVGAQMIVRAGDGSTHAHFGGDNPLQVFEAWVRNAEALARSAAEDRPDEPATYWYLDVIQTAQAGRRARCIVYRDGATEVFVMDGDEFKALGKNSTDIFGRGLL